MVNSTIYLFVGLTFSILGMVFLIYTLILLIQARKHKANGISDAIAQSLEFEQGLQPQSSLHTSDTTPLSTHNPYEQLTPMSGTSVTSESDVDASAQAASVPLAHLDQDYDHEQLVMALETLIQHRSLGIIDEYTYNKRKNDLLRHPDAPKRTLNENHHIDSADDTTIDELLIDYMEGIITSSEYERRKAQINSQS